MSDTPLYTVATADWNAGRAALQTVRRKVFVEEQGVPEELEWDDDDALSAHVMAIAVDGTPIGTGRLLRDGHIGRMAVLAEWRRKGVGSALMSCLMRLAREAGHGTVRLHAQTHAQAFYARLGFVAKGDEFMEAGIPHVMMYRQVAGDSDGGRPAA